MITIRKFGVSVAACAMALLYSTGASAQATRTWVSGVGDDVNPCSRTAPCKTFAGAISKTAAGGEINCLDPGGFGAVSINKSMTINCIYTEGGALAGGNGITINDALGPTPGQSVVYLRGLDIFGVNPPSNGVRFVSGGGLHIEDTTIRRFNAANSHGLSFQPSGPAELFISNTTIADNGNGATGGGILLQATGSGNIVAVMRNVRVRNNANIGIRIDSTSNTGTRNNVVMDEVEISGNAQGLTVISQIGTTPASVLVQDSTISGNGGGIFANGGTAAVRVTETAIIGNTSGVSNANGGAVFSYGDNILDANPDNIAPNNGSFNATIQQKR